MGPSVVRSDTRNPTVHILLERAEPACNVIENKLDPESPCLVEGISAGLVRVDESADHIQIPSMLAAGGKTEGINGVTMAIVPSSFHLRSIIQQILQASLARLGQILDGCFLERVQATGFTP